MAHAIRAHLAELGIVAPVERKGVEQLLAVVTDASDQRVPELARACVAALGAQVTFEIGASGALGYVRVDQSSGNARLDQLPLQTVQDAAPFPLPPNGAPSYTIRIDFQES